MSEIEELIKKLEEWYPNEIQMKELTAYEQGIIVGQQQIIEAIKGMFKNDN